MKTQQLSDVWQLETSSQECGVNIVNELYQQAIDGKVSSRNLLKKIYDEDWKTIKERFETEGSVWYVWLMDGVNNLLRHYEIK